MKFYFSEEGFSAEQHPLHPLQPPHLPQEEQSPLQPPLFLDLIIARAEKNTATNSTAIIMMSPAVIIRSFSDYAFTERSARVWESLGV